MKRVGTWLLVSLSIAVAVLACAPTPDNHLDAKSYRVGASVAFLERERGRVLRYQTQDRQLLAPIEEGLGRILAAESGVTASEDDQASGPCLVLLTSPERTDGSRQLAIVRGDDAKEPERHGLEPRRYRHLLLNDGIAIAFSNPAPTASIGAGGGAADSEAGVGGAGGADTEVSTTSVAILDLGKDAASAEAVELEVDEAPNFSQLAVKRTSEKQQPHTWLALSGPSQVLVVQGAGPSGFQQQGSAFKVDLAEGHQDALRAPVVQFDSNASRLFIWIPNTPEVLWLDLTVVRGQSKASPTLSRFSFETTPSAVSLVSTGTTEVVVGVTPDHAGGALVSVFDPLGMRVTSFVAGLVADSFWILPGKAAEPDRLVLYSKDPRSPRDNFGLARADSLAERVLSVAQQASPDAITVVALPTAYRSVQVADANDLFVLAEDGTAAVYNLLNDELRVLPDWTKDTHLVDIGVGRFAQIIADEEGPDGSWTIRAYPTSSAKSRSFKAPAQVRDFLQMSDSSYALIHSGVLGSFTYFDSGQEQRSYVAAGFLAAELSP